MNYKQLVISNNPSGYISYDNGNNVPDVAVAGYTQIFTGLNPTYGYTQKAMGMRSKLIGAAGSGTYDYVRMGSPGGTRKSYIHAEAWVYIPTAPATGTTANIWAAGSGTNPSVNPSTVFINDQRYVGWSTSNGSLAGPINTIYSTSQIPVNTWTHIAVSYSNGPKKIYINGVLDGSGTAPSYALNGTYYEGTFASYSIYVDEVATWAVDSAAGLPTAAETLARATFPMTKTKWWDPTTSSWITSGDEQYWTGTEWISMQSMPYKYWNGSAWITL